MTLVMALMSLLAALIGCALVLISLARLIRELFSDDGMSVPSDDLLEFEVADVNASAFAERSHGGESFGVDTAGVGDGSGRRLSGIQPRAVLAAGSVLQPMQGFALESGHTILAEDSACNTPISNLRIWLNESVGTS